VVVVSRREGAARAGSGEERLVGAVLVVEDSPEFRTLLRTMLGQVGLDVTEAATAAAATDQLERQDHDLVLLDLGLPDMDGLELLARLRQIDDRLVVVVLTGRGDIETVVEAMKRGAENFLVKPVERAALLSVVERALEGARLLRAQHSTLAERRRRDPGEPVGSSRAMRRVRELAARVAETDASVVLTGESGTGKGLVAQLIHRLSRRSEAPMLDLNCAALPPQFLESELFGHERGAFTDARDRKMGLFEVAHGGTVFLDEIAEMDPLVQGKLLKSLEDRRFRRLGGVRDINVDVRLIVATSANLRERVEAGGFRQDLFYRLNVFEITLPALRERGDDVMALAMHFIGQLNPVLHRRVARIASSATALLSAYPWPGNVRELRNVVERALILAQGEELGPEHLPPELHRPQARPPVGMSTLAELERNHIRAAIEATGGNLKSAAATLGIARSTLYRKIEEHGLKP
jgi:DNA-binding NtrC family response regulator